MEKNITAGIFASCLFVASNLPMLSRAYKTRDLGSYSLAYLVLNNVANLFYWFYIVHLPFGPIWILHGFYTISMMLMLTWHWRFRAIELDIR